MMIIERVDSRLSGGRFFRPSTSGVRSRRLGGRLLGRGSSHLGIASRLAPRRNQQTQVDRLFVIVTQILDDALLGVD